MFTNTTERRVIVFIILKLNRITSGATPAKQKCNYG